MKPLILLSILLTLSISCKTKRTLSLNTENKDIYSLNIASSSNTFNLIAYPQDLQCQGNYENRNFLENNVKNYDLNHDFYNKGKIYLNQALSAIPSSTIEELAAYNGTIYITQNLYKSCEYFENGISSEVAKNYEYCLKIGKNSFDLFLKLELDEDKKLDVRILQRSTILAIMEAYTTVVLSLQKDENGEFQERDEAFSIPMNMLSYELILNVKNRLGFEYEASDSMDGLNYYLFASVCSPQTRQSMLDFDHDGMKKAEEFFALTQYLATKNEESQDSELNLASNFFKNFADYFGGSKKATNPTIEVKKVEAEDISGGRTLFTEDKNKPYVEAFDERLKNPSDVNVATKLESLKSSKQLDDLRNFGEAIYRNAEAIIPGFYRPKISELYDSIKGNRNYELIQSTTENTFMQYKKGDLDKIIDAQTLRILIPGTFEGQAGKVSGWFDPDGAVAQVFAKRDTDSATTVTTAFRWDGKNSKKSRDTAAIELAHVIRKVGETYPNLKIELVGHSHGGNIALGASESLGDSFKNVDIVTIATPPRTDYTPNPNAKVTHIFSQQDLVAQLGKGDGAVGPNALRRFKYGDNFSRSGTTDQKLIQLNMPVLDSAMKNHVEMPYVVASMLSSGEISIRNVAGGQMRSIQ